MAPQSPPAAAHDGGAASSTATATTTIPCNVLLSSALRPLPFSSPCSHSPPPHPDWTVPLAAAAQRLAQALSSAASSNPFLKPLISLSSDYRAFVEVRCRGSRLPSTLSAHNFAAILPGDSVAGLVVANGLSNFLNIYNTLLVVRLVLTWFPNSPPAIVSPLSTLCDPYLNIFRGIIPPLGGTLDLSPILAFLVLNAFTSTAAALPAELPGTTALRQDTSPMQSLTAAQRKWMKRLSGKIPNDSEDAE